MRSSRTIALRLFILLIFAHILAASLGGCGEALAPIPSYDGYINGANLTYDATNTSYPYGVLASVVPAEQSSKEATIRIRTVKGNAWVQVDAVDLCNWSAAHPGSLEQTAQKAKDTHARIIDAKPIYFDDSGKRFTKCPK